MPTAALAAHPQPSPEIGLGELLCLQIREELFECLDFGRGVADRVGEVLLIAFNLQLGDLCDQSVGADVANEPIDLACSQLTFAWREPAEVACSRLTKAIRVDVLNTRTSELNYTEMHQPVPRMSR